MLVDLYTSLDTEEYNAVCRCLMFLDDYTRVADILSKLLGKGEVRVCACAHEVLESPTRVADAAPLGLWEGMADPATLEKCVG